MARRGSSDTRTRRPFWSRRSPWLSLVVVTLAAAFTAGCSSIALPFQAPSCPPRWDAAVLWSSDGWQSSQLAYVADAQVVQRQHVSHRGFAHASNSLGYRRNGMVVMASGDLMKSSEPEVVTMSTQSCEVIGHPLASLPLAMTGHDDTIFASNNSMVDGSVIERLDTSGRVLAGVEVDLFVDELIIEGDTLYAFGSALPSDDLFLLALDADTLTEQRRVRLDWVGRTGAGPVIAAGRLYYPQAEHPSGLELSQLGVVELDSFEQSTIDLGTVSPFMLAEAGGKVYVGHVSFGGPRSLGEYRWVSRLDPQTGRIEGFDVGIGVSSITVHDQSLYVLGQTTADAKDDTVVRLREFDLAALTLRSETVVERPGWFSHHYPSQLIVP